MADEFASKYKKCQRITVSLIADRNIPNKAGLSADEMTAALLELSHVRLDREEISTIDDLDCLGPVTNLYLQKNKIEKIQNLDALPNLRFLTLADNKIITVENLKMLTDLRFLDLSNNMIEHIDPGKLPPGLLMLLLKGNPMRNADYRTELLQALPALQQLDGQMITTEDRRKAGCTVESDSESEGESDEEELENCDSMDDNITKGSLRQHCDDIIARAKIRTLKEEKEHEKRMEELAHFCNLHLQAKCKQSPGKH